MEIIDFFKSDKPDHWLYEIKKGDWGAIPTLVRFIEEASFHENLGEGTLLLLTEGERLLSFVTFAQRDCIDDPCLSPWIGFVFTFPQYRGRRCEEIAAEKEIPAVFVCTDHAGLYEKYGFSYVESRRDIYGGDSRIYRKNISEKDNKG